LLTRTLTIVVAAITAVALTLALLGLRETSEHPAYAAAAEVETEKPKPNIVLVMADDMRADDLRFMPSLRKLVTDRGLKFRNSFSPFPLCCPSRASLLSGQYAHNHKVLNNDAPF
jgi:predicted AlkP superfamily pyrophosphatase or phosphodiesterase